MTTPGRSNLIDRGRRRGQRATSVAFAVAVAAPVLVTLAVPSSARAATWPMPPAEHDYATAWGVDPFGDADLHVGAVGGLRTAVSFLRFDLGAIPATATVDQLVLSLTPNTKPEQNLGGGVASAPAIAACLHDGDATGDFDPTAAPTWDCETLSVPVEPAPNGTWTADLLAFVEPWRADRAAGLALVADTDVPAPEAWVRSFDPTNTFALASYGLTAPAPTVSVPQVASAPAAAAPRVLSADLSRTSPVASPPTTEIELTTQVGVLDPAGAPSAAPPVGGTTAAVAATTPPPLAAYGAVAFWSACATLLAVGTVLRLRTAHGHTLRSFLGVVEESAHLKSTWLAGVPLSIVVFGGLAAVGYMVHLNNQVTPVLEFAELDADAVAPSTDAAEVEVAGVEVTVPGAPSGRANTSPDAPRVGDGRVAAPAPDTSGASPAGRSATSASSDLDGEWVVGAGSVAGYRWDYSSPTGNGTRVGRTREADGIAGTFRLSGSTVTAAEVTVDMRKVFCDAGSTCDDHVNEIMDTERHPFETLALARRIELGNLPADGETVRSSVTATLTLRGVSRQVTFELQSRRNAGRIEVLGSIPVNRDDYGIPDADQPGFSIARDGLIELLMVFQRSGG